MIFADQRPEKAGRPVILNSRYIVLGTSKGSTSHGLSS